MKKMKKLLCCLLITAMIIGGTLTVYAEGTTDITDESVDRTAEIEVVVGIQSQFTVGIPTTASINPKTGEGSYQISVLGDLDPRYQLVVAPEDSYTTELGDTTENINFLLKDTNILDPKEDVVVNITSGQTTFIATDINLETPTVINNTMNVADGALSAGNWTGTIKYTISLEEINAGDEEPTT